MENINPLVKVVHIPTLEAQLFKAFEDLGSVTKELETLMFSIYAITTTSITESECEKILREPKPSVLNRYFDATRQSLVRVGFLQSSSMTVLQALTMFLVCSIGKCLDLERILISIACYSTILRLEILMDTLWYRCSHWSGDGVTPRRSSTQYSLFRSRDATSVMVADCPSRQYRNTQYGCRYINFDCDVGCKVTIESR